MTTSPTQGAIPHIDLTPRAGQPDADVDAWLKTQNRSEGVAARLYARELYKERDNLNSSHGDWYDRLTARQRGLLDLAREERRAEFRKTPAYEADKARWREHYRQKAEAAGREVRRYQHGRSKDEVRLDRKQRNEKMRAHIRGELAAGRNPFPNEGQHKAKHLICETLLREGCFAPTLTATEIAKACGVSLSDAHPLIASALEALRTAKAIRKERGIIHLHRDIERQRDLDEVKDNPNWGIV